MNENVFSKKFITLRKKYNFTQQDIADKLNVSNKTISRWETNEGYPDIDLLPKIASVFHVSIDYLLKDHDDFKEIDKLDIVSYFPWLISLSAVLIFYVFCALAIPVIFSFIVYYFIIQFSYHFLKQYTDRKNGNTLVKINTISHFFVCSTMSIQVLIMGIVMSQAGTLMPNGQLFLNNNSSLLVIPYVLGYTISAIYAFIHYTSHKKEDYYSIPKKEDVK
ncbi:MAG: helix-turn-helix transcriptional regulator [Coprobacillus sp.]